MRTEQTFPCLSCSAPTTSAPLTNKPPSRAELADEEVDSCHGLHLAVLLVEDPATQVLCEGWLQLVQIAGGDQLDPRSQEPLRLGQSEQRFKFFLAAGHYQTALGLELDPVSSVSRLLRQLMPQFHPPQSEG